jgi:anti-sigma factor RsiW
MFHRHRFSKFIVRVRCLFCGTRQSATPALTCQQMVEFIADYLTGALDTETTLAFEAHLHGCDDCIAFLETYQRTIATVHSLRFEEIPAELEERLRRFIGTRVRRSEPDR